MGSKKITAMIPVLGDEDGEVTRRLVELMKQGLLPQGIILLNVDAKKSYKETEQKPQEIILDRSLTQGHQPILNNSLTATDVSWPVV